MFRIRMCVMEMKERGGEVRCGVEGKEEDLWDVVLGRRIEE